MRSTRSRRRSGVFTPAGSCAHLLGAILGAAALLSAGGCSKSPSEAPGSTADGSTIRKDVYTVRGIIEVMPDAAKETEFQVRHEAIPHFRQGGSKLGMPTMIMPFPLAQGLTLGELKKGDKVELTFEVDFDTKIDRLVAYRATAVSKLPDDTVIHFSLDPAGAKPKDAEPQAPSSPESPSPK